MSENVESLGEPVTLHPERAEQGMRLDRFVADRLTDLSRGTVQKLIDSGHVLVDGIARKPKFRMTPGEVVTVDVPPPAPDEILPDPLPLRIVYEDDDIIAIDKPAGLVVHPAPGHPRGTLANALVAHVPGISVGGSNRPGIVHRLDKDTSGLIVAAKTDLGRGVLLSQWADKSVEKIYIALVSGVVAENEATIDAPIGRDQQNRQRMGVVRGDRPAVTHVRVQERFPDATLLEVQIDTGRTHQIRVHLAFIGHPVVGDAVYGRPRPADPDLDRQFLHAAALALDLPDGRRVRWTSALPPDLESALHELRDRREPRS